MQTWILRPLPQAALTKMTNAPEFRHILVIEDQKARRIVALEEATYSIGRESSSDIVIYDRAVSRHHATLIRIKVSPKVDTYSYRILDGDLEGNRSTNGLLINGQVKETHDLQHGDVVVFGGDSKASYYIVSTALEVAMFNPMEMPLYNPPSIPPEEQDSQSTIVSDLEDLPATQTSVDLIRFTSFAELSPQPIIEMDFTGKIIYVNPAASIKFKTIQRESSDHPVIAGLLDQAQNVRGNLLLREIQVQDEVYEQYVHYLTETQVIRSYLIDITQRKQSEKLLAQHTLYDPLTTLPNRGWFEEQLAIAIAKAQRDGSSIAVAFLEFENFSRMVNAFGHNCGDQLLKTVAQRLKENLKQDGAAARWQGSQFVILLRKAKDQPELVQSAEALLGNLHGLINVSGQPLHLKGKLGIAVYPQDGEEAESLLKNAYSALGQTQNQGYAPYGFFNAKAATKSNLLIRLENLLYGALEKNQFYLTYQPILNLNTAEITGMETLLRWHHPELGEISPVNLIPLAEKTDLIIPIGEWILKLACEQNQQWQASGLAPFPLSVNLSLRQFQQPGLASKIAQILQNTRLPPRWLILELTESIIMDNPDFSRSVLRELGELGVRISLDDFGTGMGSLTCLQQFQPASLKIHQSFIHSLTTNADNRAIISAVLGLGHHFHLRVIAEGVENLPQLEILQKLNCEEVQGFYFTKPLRAEDATAYLAQCKIQAAV